MNSMLTLGKQTKRIAGFAAVVATLFTAGGTLTLAEHYAHAGRAGHDYAAGNLATKQALPTVRRHA